MTAEWCAYFERIIGIGGPNHPAFGRAVGQAVRLWPKERNHILTGALLAISLSATALVVSAMKTVAEEQTALDRRLARLEGKECSGEAS